MTAKHPPRAGAVASEQGVASDIGTAILAQGGNAVDALVATCLAVNVLAPYHSDIGGGGFALIRTSQGEYESYDFRHTAPVSMLDCSRVEGSQLILLILRQQRPASGIQTKAPRLGDQLLLFQGRSEVWRRFIKLMASCLGRHSSSPVSNLRGKA